MGPGLASPGEVEGGRASKQLFDEPIQGWEGFQDLAPVHPNGGWAPEDPVPIGGENHELAPFLLSNGHAQSLSCRNSGPSARETAILPPPVEARGNTFHLLATQKIQDGDEREGVGNVDGVPLRVHVRVGGFELGADGGGELVLEGLKSVGDEDFCRPQSPIQGFTQGDEVVPRRLLGLECTLPETFRLLFGPQEDDLGHFAHEPSGVVVGVSV